jgi:large subunit ribosomal protein L29
MREIRDLSLEDQQIKIVELKTELVRLRTMVKAGGAIENPARIREIRKHIARILTVMNESKSA